MNVFPSCLQMLDPLSMSSPDNSGSGSCPSLDSPLDRWDYYHWQGCTLKAAWCKFCFDRGLSNMHGAASRCDSPVPHSISQNTGKESLIINLPWLDVWFYSPHSVAKVTIWNQTLISKHLIRSKTLPPNPTQQLWQLNKYFWALLEHLQWWKKNKKLTNRTFKDHFLPLSCVSQCQFTKQILFVAPFLCCAAITRSPGCPEHRATRTTTRTFQVIFGKHLCFLWLKGQ